jgi:hypothetical protein
MYPSIGAGIIVAALVALLLGHAYLKHRARLRRLELIHAERLAAMDKGIPLPELPLDPPPDDPARPPDGSLMLFPGMVLTVLGAGMMIAFGFTEFLRPVWLLPLPLALIGVGMLLYSFLPTDRAC